MLSTLQRCSDLEGVQLISIGALEALDLGMAALLQGVHALLSAASCAFSFSLGRRPPVQPCEVLTNV